MKILFLASAKDIHTCKWVNKLVDKNNEVLLVYCKNHRPGSQKIDSRVSLVELPYNSGIGYYINVPKLKRIIQEFKPDVINAHYASGYGTLIRLSKAKRVVLSVWGADVYDFPYKNKLNMYILKKNLNFADEIASTSNIMANQVRKILNNKSVNITITPFGVDIERFRPVDKQVKENKVIKIGIVKRIAQKYGIKYLIDAFDIVNTKIGEMPAGNSPKEVFLDIYGDGDQKEELIKYVEKLKLSEKIKFHGIIPNEDVPKALSKLDVFVVSSILDSESFGVAAVEAMSMGLPVVATDVDGFKEVIEDRKTGIIIPRKNSEKMSEALLELIYKDDLRAEMGKQGRKRVEKLYDFSENVDTMIDLYKDVTD